MFDTMTMVKAVGGFCGALLVFLFANWAAQTLYFGGEGGDERPPAFTVAVADAVADVVATGTTLKQAGLVVLGDPLLVSQALLVQRAGVPHSHEIDTFVRRLQGVIVARAYVLVDYDIRAELVTEACAITRNVLLISEHVRARLSRQLSDSNVDENGVIRNAEHARAADEADLTGGAADPARRAVHRTRVGDQLGLSDAVVVRRDQHDAELGTDENEYAARRRAPIVPRGPRAHGAADGGRDDFGRPRAKPGRRPHWRPSVP
mgnify:CR=1 FL=1